MQYHKSITNSTQPFAIELKAGRVSGKRSCLFIIGDLNCLGNRIGCLSACETHSAHHSGKWKAERDSVLVHTKNETPFRISASNFTSSIWILSPICAAAHTRLAATSSQKKYDDGARLRRSNFASRKRRRTSRKDET